MFHLRHSPAIKNAHAWRRAHGASHHNQEVPKSRKKTCKTQYWSLYLKGRQFYRFNKEEFNVRLHIGLEDPKDLINDLKNGLKKIK